MNRSQLGLELYKEPKQNEGIINQHWRKLETLLKGDKADWKFILGHHPIKTYGAHRDRYTNNNPSLQDLSHPAYKSLSGA